MKKQYSLVQALVIIETQMMLSDITAIEYEDGSRQTFNITISGVDKAFIRINDKGNVSEWNLMK